MFKIFLIIILLLPFVGSQANGLPDMRYLGAFLLPENAKDKVSSFNNVFGPLALNQDLSSIFIVGDQNHQAIAEVTIPNFRGKTKLNNLPRGTFKQPFSKVLNRAKHGNPQTINRITGLLHVDGQLIVNGAKYYNAPANNTDTTVIMRNADSLKTSVVDGYFKVKGRTRAAGWISDVPEPLKKQMNTNYITGYASNLPITVRSSVGPSLFAISIFGVLDESVTDGLIWTQAYLDFPMATPLHKDLYNENGKNDIWTIASWAVYGFFTPKNQYLVLGESLGHRKGLGYKITQTSGRKCGGPCPRDPADRDNYYWSWDMSALLAKQQGVNTSFTTKPDHYGIVKWENIRKPIAGAVYDRKNNLLYILEKNAESRGKYTHYPIIHVYEIL
jgi:hypothetical protein